jgi:hypothetical protein
MNQNYYEKNDQQNTLTNNFPHYNNNMNNNMNNYTYPFNHPYNNMHNHPCNPPYYNNMNGYNNMNNMNYTNYMNNPNYMNNLNNMNNSTNMNNYNQYGSMIPQNNMPCHTYCPECTDQHKKEKITDKKQTQKYIEHPKTTYTNRNKKKTSDASKKLTKPKEFNNKDFGLKKIKNDKKQNSKNKDKSFNGGTLVVTTNAPSGAPPVPLLSGILNMIIGGGGEEDDEQPFNPFAMMKKEVEVTEVKEEEEEPEDLSQCEFKHAGPIKNLNDLIKLGKEYGKSDIKYRYNINMKKLSKMVGALEEFQALIGMKKIKKEIFSKIIFYLQELESNKDMLHMAIQGGPGVGKTCIIEILAKVYKALGILSKGHIVKAKRDDLIAGYLGQTAIKTKKLIEKAKGGILVIDEAYALGNEELRDSYSKEAIDTITPYLSEEANDMICIIAGYEDQLDKCLFAYNEGLERRFTRYTIDKYSDAELRQIFIKIVMDNEWNFMKDDDEDVKERTDRYNNIKVKYDELEKEHDEIDNNTNKTKKRIHSIENELDKLKKDMDKIPIDSYLTSIPLEFFEKNRKYFKFSGGDMLKLFEKCKNSHAGRLLKITDEKLILKSKKNINHQDIENGFKLFLIDPKVSQRGEVNPSMFMMYN